VGYCVQCHNPHGAGSSGKAYNHLTASDEEQVCFACHGAGVSPINALDMQIQMNKLYTHQISYNQGLHDDYAESTSPAVKPNPLLSGSNRHVECADCHNAHFGRQTLHAAQSSNIGDIILGTWGIRPTYSGAQWTTATAYTVQRFQDTASEYEYYLCLKCHSDWAWGASAPYTKDGVTETNVAVEINPANAAYHNVTGQPVAAVPASNGGAYIAPWTHSSAMSCSDCHGSDPASSIVGPHASSYSFMLKAPIQARLNAAGNTGTAGTSSHLCFSCHDWNTYGPGGTGTQTNFTDTSLQNLHTQAEHATSNGCFQCHTVVPHGFNRPHMIVYTTDPSPYFIGGNQGIVAYTTTNPGAYAETSCTTAGTGCHVNVQRMRRRR
jgi:predicted CXXCH cytochrome family protein